MVKPIFIIGWPEVDPNDAGWLAAKEINQTSFDELLKATKHLQDEYYLLVYTKMGGEPIFHAFYEKDFDEVKYEELKGIVENLGKK